MLASSRKSQREEEDQKPQEGGRKKQTKGEPKQGRKKDRTTRWRTLRASSLEEKPCSVTSLHQTTQDNKYNSPIANMCKISYISITSMQIIDS
jgi:hypothetical protein